MWSAIINELKSPMVKAISAWGAALLASAWHTFSTIPWDKFAQFAAFVYSLCLIYSWLRERRNKSNHRGFSNGTD